MKKLLSIYICLFFICFPAISFSQEEPKPEPKKVTVEVLDDNLIKWGEIKYVLFEEVAAANILEKVIKYPKLELKLVKLTELNVLYLEQIALGLKINTNLREQTSFLTEEAATLKKQLDEGTPWWKSTWFLLGLGFLTGTGLTIGIMYLIK